MSHQSRVLTLIRERINKDIMRVTIVILAVLAVMVINTSAQGAKKVANPNEKSTINGARTTPSNKNGQAAAKKNEGQSAANKNGGQSAANKNAQNGARSTPSNKNGQAAAKKNEGQPAANKKAQNGQQNQRTKPSKKTRMNAFY